MSRLILIAIVLLGGSLSAVARADQPVKLTLLGYSVAKPVYAKIMPAFKKQFKADTGQDVTFTESYGASGAQTRSIVGGLEADILATNVQVYVDPLVEAGLVTGDWAKRLPNGGSPASSVIAIVVRPDNPKGIKTWSDLTKDGVRIVAINPKTSGNARWGVLAGYAALTHTQDVKAAEGYVRGLVRNTKTLVSGGREATDAFVKNRVGDALLTFENEAKFANKVAGNVSPFVVPDVNVRVDFPVVVVDKNVDKHGTRKAAEAFAAFLFTPAAQAIFAETGYRPLDAKVAEQHTADFAKVGTLLSIDDAGGWPALNKALFDDGALYDQAQAAGK